MINLCDTCKDTQPICGGMKIKFGIDEDPNAACTVDADAVIQCDCYESEDCTYTGIKPLRPWDCTKCENCQWKGKEK